MRTLTRHEKKLTIFLVAAVAVGLHLIVLKVLLSLDRAKRRELAQAQEELAEDRDWLAQKELWQEKAAWLEKHFRSIPAENPAPVLQKLLQNSADQAGLKVEEQKPPVPKPGPHTMVYANRMRMSGNLGQFLDWLVKVYKPEDGIAVTSLNLKIGPEPPKMVGEAAVGQFFRPNNP
ncbi:hypothetical protein EBZ02_05935 [bacterium]|nr:hypothetical protein [bacterium]